MDLFFNSSIRTLNVCFDDEKCQEDQLKYQKTP